MSFFQNARYTDARFSAFNLHLHTTSTFCECQSGEVVIGQSVHGTGFTTQEKPLPIPPLALGILQHKLDGGCDEAPRPVSKTGHGVKTYLNHALWYASPDKNTVTRTDHPPEQVYDLRIAYWYLMYRHLSHMPLRPGTEQAAREALNVYIMEGLRRRSESRAPFSLEESQKLLKWLNKRDGENADFVMLSPSGNLLTQSSARTLIVSWILFNVAYHSKAIKYGLQTKGQITGSFRVRSSSQSHS